MSGFEADDFVTWKTYIDRVWLKHDLVENIQRNNTLHIFTPFIYNTHINHDYGKNRIQIFLFLNQRSSHATYTQQNAQQISLVAHSLKME